MERYDTALAFSKRINIDALSQVDILNLVKQTVQCSRLNYHTKQSDQKLNDDNVDIKGIYVACICIRYIVIKVSHQYVAQLYFLV